MLGHIFVVQLGGRLIKARMDDATEWGVPYGVELELVVVVGNA